MVIKLFSPEDIVFNPYRILIGSIGLNMEKDCCLVSPVYKSFGVNEKNNAFFIFNLLKRSKTLMIYKTISNKGVRNNLNLKAFKKLTFKLPSLKEQTKIANFLKLLDQRIRIEQALLNNYQTQQKYFFNQLFF
ncbi:restriction endonuclease subunit S [Candidatus Phytoplasma luffae]|uniref:restriction endonuclease subunit S n=1 Tax=Loofah witches'-broom phytoplasma TaxID=35773 RepID=UPI001B37F5BF|nr:restriction endonuclease subunit S [Candidatus Phytoplasma luffae]